MSLENIYIYSIPSIYIIGHSLFSFVATTFAQNYVVSLLVISSL